MTYKEATALKAEKMNLIGTIDKKGFVINEIIIVPTDESKKNLFMQSYVINRNSEACLLPYINDDVQLWAVDTEYLEKANVLFFDVLD